MVITFAGAGLAASFSLLRAFERFALTALPAAARLPRSEEEVEL